MKGMDRKMRLPKYTQYREAGWCGVVNLWDPRDAERSVKAPGKKGHLSWAWKTEEFAS